MELPIDRDRLSERLDVLAQIGADPRGGITRLVYSEEERAAAERVERWMQDAGLSTRYDAVGNLFGRWEADARPAIWTGSHLDSVPNGGRFDGPAGVLASLAAIEALIAADVRPAYPIEVCVFVGEEGSRFPGGLLGSRAVVDGLTANELNAADASGTTVGEAMRACGLDPDHAYDACRDPVDVRAYLELHIEQGPVLDDAGVPVGVVTGIAGPLLLDGEIIGRTDHAGTTPMGSRADSLVAACELALAVERAAKTGSTTVATVGRIECDPGAVNVIPGRTAFSIDLRDIDVVARARAEDAIRASFESIVAARRLSGDLRESLRVDPQPIPEHLVHILETCARSVSVTSKRLPSGAAHDAMVLGRITDSAMIFVRSVDGRSHNPEEYTSVNDLGAGAAVLAAALAGLSANDRSPPEAPRRA